MRLSLSLTNNTRLSGSVVSSNAIRQRDSAVIRDRAGATILVRS